MWNLEWARALSFWEIAKMSCSPLPHSGTSASLTKWQWREEQPVVMIMDPSAAL